jgi:prolipoprotein diacylglyceryltransferase
VELVLTFKFDSGIQIAGVTLRLETLGLAASILATLLAAAYVAGNLGSGPEATDLRRLRARRREVSPFDFLFIALGTVPGALAAGRVGYILAHIDYYQANPSQWLTGGQGSMELGLAVVGGTLSGIFVAQALAVPISRWLHIAAAPLLLGLALGKMATALGGEGQGLPSDAPWATSYEGSGPWGSLAPAVPSHPAQLYEAALTFVALGLLIALARAGRFRDLDGRAYFAALYLWAVGRSIAGIFSRDPAILGPLQPGQIISLAIAGGSLVLWMSFATISQQNQRTRRSAPGG